MIKTEGLCKRFGSLQAVDHISLTIEDSSIFGLAGTNGAGKSTFLRMLAGVLKPDEGKISIDGEPVFKIQRSKRKFFSCRIPLISFLMLLLLIWKTIMRFITPITIGKK